MGSIVMTAGSGLLLIWFLIFVWSFMTNSDIFAPSKVFSLIILVFFGDVFVGDYPDFVHYNVILLLMINASLVIFEKKAINTYGRFNVGASISRSLVGRIWFLSILPISAQIYLIHLMGGLEPYIASIGLRVYEWKGLGFVIVLIKAFNVLNYLYFIFIVKLNRINWAQYLMFGLHLTIFIIISLMSGSRSTLLWNFVFMTVYYHYNRTKISSIKAGLVFASILIFAMLLGNAREGYNLNDGRLETGLSQTKSLLKMSNFKYGLDPMVLLSNRSVENPKLGMTYLSAITNLVPRKIWENKPDTGGMVITKEYFNDAYGGYSYLSPGLIPEAMINFGEITGFVFAALLIIILLFLLGRYTLYQNNIARTGDLKKYILYSGLYPFLLFGILSYLYAEFTTNTISLVIFKITLYFFVVVFVFHGKNTRCNAIRN